MATYDVAAGELGVHAITLTANDECLVRFAEDVSTIEILNMDGIAPLYFVVNGKKAATVAGRRQPTNSMIGHSWKLTLPSVLATFTVSAVAWVAKLLSMISPLGLVRSQ